MTTTHAGRPGRKASAVLGWFPLTPATEREVLDMASARQIALRTRLRNHYWLNDCKPIGEVTLSQLRRKMVMVDPNDEMSHEQVDELLSPHFGFMCSADGWTIPELLEAREEAIGAIQSVRERASLAGKASAAKRAAHGPLRAVMGVRQGPHDPPASVQPPRTLDHDHHHDPDPDDF